MTLYAVYIQGPDEIIAAPSKHEAKALANKLNAFFVEMFQKSTPAAPNLEAVVIAWPYAPSEHANDIEQNWAGHAKFIGPVDPEPERDTRTIDMFVEAKC